MRQILVAAVFVAVVVIVALTWDSSAPTPPVVDTNLEAAQASGGAREGAPKPTPSTAESGVDAETSDIPPAERTQATPIVTLSGSLEKRYAAKNWGDYSRVEDVLKTISGVLRSPFIDRSGVKLTEQDYARLEELVAKHNESIGAAYERAGDLRQAGMAKAAREGRYVANKVSSLPSLSPVVHEAWRDQQKAELDDTMMRIREKHGLAEQDWRFVVSGTSKPDGVHRRVVVWFTRFEEPGYFDAHREHVKAKQARQQDFDGFFARLRR
jgi:hypothetical protein